MHVLNPLWKSSGNMKHPKNHPHVEDIIFFSLARITRTAHAPRFDSANGDNVEHVSRFE